MVELVEVVLARKYGAIREHFCQNTANRPDINGLGVALGVEHNLWCSVPPGGHIFGQEPSMIVFWVSNSCKAKVTNFEVARSVQQKIAWLEVSMKNISRVNVFETS